MLNRVVFAACAVTLASVPASGQPGGPVQLTFDPPWTGKEWPAWSPDGDWIAYVRAWRVYPDLYVAIYKVPASGGPAVAVSDASANLWKHRVSWSSDRTRIYFEQKNAFSRAFAGLPSMVPAQGGTASLLTTEQARSMVLSQNGRWLVYVVASRLGEPEQTQGIRGLDLVRHVVTPLVGGVPEYSHIQLAPNGTMVGYWLWDRLAAWSAWGNATLLAIPFGCNFIFWGWGPTGDRLSMWSQGCFGPLSDLRWARPFEGVAYPLAPNRPTGYHAWSRCGSYLAAGGYWRTKGSNDLGVVEVPSGRVSVLCQGCCDGGYPTVTWSPFRDEVAWLYPVAGTNSVELFKAPTGLHPTPALIGTLMPGTVATIRIKASGDGGLAYVVGASFGTEPGIRTARGVIPLNLDPLLLLSLSGAPMFRFFTGLLDGMGRGEAFLELPPVARLVGTRFFVGYVTQDPAQPGGIRTISGAIPFFVQPLG